MQTLHVTGGVPLHGSVRIGGAKNASYKLMIAALLGSQESRLLNFSRISDVETVAEIIQVLGATVTRAGERAIFINPQSLQRFVVPAEHGAQGRFSNMFVPALLARFGQAVVPAPGGDKIGTRPLERHWAGLEAMGARIEPDGAGYRVSTPGLHGTTYRFKKNSHTGTETLIMAAVKATGTTILENAALEPEVDDLIAFLNAMGGRIRRRADRVIEIVGVEQLGGAIHSILPDRNEAVSYACAAIATGGDVIIENARPQHLQAFLDKVKEIGAGYETGSYGIRFFSQGQLRAADIQTQIEPGFMTDWQPLWATVATQCQGVSTIHETIMQQRFQYVDNLQQMGAKIEFFNPEITDLDKTYNFNLEDDRPEDFHAIKIYGTVKLQAGSFKILDLRQGATVILAALIAQGTSVISNLDQVDRGYEDLDARLRSMGAKMIRVEE